MQKNWICLGLMSGSSGDGVDASIIKTNGINHYEILKDKYFEYDSYIYNSIHNLKQKISKIEHLKSFDSEIKNLERKITIFHAEIIKSFDLSSETIVGFHGQTIYHNYEEKISRQLGNGNLLKQLTNKKIVYDFRSNDILNGGQGAPLTPVFHHLISFQHNIKLPICFLNIGGISNITIIKDRNELSRLISKDIGPGNCLIDSWVRKNSSKKFDKDGKLASIGKKNEIIFEQALELYANRKNKDKLSFDTNDFDVSFVRGLNLEDGAATLTDFTASIISEELTLCLSDSISKFKEILLCGGGRKNKILLEMIKKKLPNNINLKLIDDYQINGDFVESQAFAYLAARSIMNLPLSYPNTTGCKVPTKGGKQI